MHVCSVANLAIGAGGLGFPLVLPDGQQEKSPKLTSK